MADEPHCECESCRRRAEVDLAPNASCAREVRDAALELVEVSGPELVEYNPTDVRIMFDGVELEADGVLLEVADVCDGDVTPPAPARSSVTFDVSPVSGYQFDDLVRHLRELEVDRLAGLADLRAIYIPDCDLEALLDSPGFGEVVSRRPSRTAKETIAISRPTGILELRTLPYMKTGTVFAAWTCPKCRVELVEPPCSRCMGTGEVVGPLYRQEEPA